MLSDYDRLPRRRLSVGQGGARHLRHLLDRRAVHLPRYYIYHQATTPGSAEDRAWIEREDRARTIILMPAMLIVWTLGLMLAVHLGAFDQPWLMAKLALVVAAVGLPGLDRRPTAASSPRAAASSRTSACG